MAEPIEQHTRERIFGVELERTVTREGQSFTVRCYRDGYTVLILKSSGLTIAGWHSDTLNAYKARTLSDAQLWAEVREVVQKIAGHLV